MIILLVEDTDDTRELYSFILKVNGYAVLEAVDGKEAVNTAIEEKPDIILMDLNLPVMSGWEATRMLKSIPETREIPIIAVSANTLAEYRDSILTAGADDYLTKPLNPQKLLDTIRSFQN
jgi:two-component system cell cycle response regulator DivK